MPQARRRIPPATAACRRLNLLLWLACVPGAATAATFRPGERADPPTGDQAAGAPSAAEPLREGGFEWVFAPPRVNGVLSLDMRALRLDDGSTSTQAVQSGEAEWATYLWQPWFAQVRFGLGYVASRDLSAGASGADQGGQGTSLTGRFSTQLFPASRFPFELRADLSDSRSSGDSLLGDLRSRRVSLSQSYRPDSGNDSYQFQLDHSRVDTASGGDTLLSVQGTAVHLTVDHRFELGASLSNHEREDTGDTTRVQSVTARHGYHPERHLDIETLASWNDVQLRSGVPGGLDFGVDVRQVSTLVTWRPGRDDVAESGEDGAEPDPAAPLPPPSSLLVAGSARWMASRAGVPGGPGEVQGVNASVGVSQDLSRDWRASAAVSVNALHGGGLAEGRSVLANGTLTWAPMGGAWGDWRYSPSAAATLSAGTDSGLGRRAQAGLQGAHSLSRDLPLAGGVVSISLAQSAGALHETLERRTSSALAHSIGLSWQVQGEGGRQSLAGLSLSDSRTWSDGSGSFQFVNLQLSQRQQLSRYSLWSANLTAQAFRNRSTNIDVFTGERRLLETGWQPYYSGSLNLEQARLWGVPRLRHTLLLGFSSQQLESRAFGDIDAPRQHISESFESRLDYSIGRLEARLSARAARIDGRWVAALVARLQRHF